MKYSVLECVVEYSAFECVVKYSALGCAAAFLAEKTRIARQSPLVEIPSAV